MVTAILNHEVKDYAAWRKVFDKDAANRSKAGFNITGVYQSFDDPHKVTVIGETPSAGTIKEFFDRPELKATMEEAGVIGMPEVKILSKV